MMSNLNVVTVEGRLVEDPKIIYLPSGVAKVSFKIANNRFWKGEKKTNWLDVIFFGKHAETIARYFTKGRIIIVSGELVSDIWTGNDGKLRKTIYILGRDFSFAGSNGNGQTSKINNDEKTTVQKTTRSFQPMEASEEDDFSINWSDFDFDEDLEVKEEYIKDEKKDVGYDEEDNEGDDWLP